jgi:hypothetical protein
MEMLIRSLSWTVLLSTSWFAGGILLAQQADTAVIIGAVKDESGVVMPKVPIKLTHGDTGSTYSVNTDETGYYRSPPVRPGAYTLSAK